MSDLYIMFDEAYDAPTLWQRTYKLMEIAKRYQIDLNQLFDAYGEYIDSDQFYIERGI